MSIAIARKAFGALLIMSLLALASACGSSSRGASSASATIGGGGGTVSLAGGPTLNIPAAALPSDTTITVSASSASPPAGAMTPLFVFGPDGTQFAQPVEVRFNVPVNTSAASLYWSQLGKTTYDLLPVTVDGAIATGHVTHFSQGFVGAACSSGASCSSTSPCHVAALDCSSGAPACTDTGNIADGTSCGGGMACKAGVCMTSPPPTTVSVSVSLSGQGSVSSTPAGLSCAAGSCTGSFVQGTPVTLTATPSSSWFFTGWTGSVCSGTGTCALPALSANVSLGATFAQEFLLGVIVSGNGTVSSTPAGISCGSGTCAADFLSGTAVELTEAAQAGSVFSGWSGDCSGTSTCALTMSASHSVTATFAPVWTVTVATAGQGSVSSTPAGLSCAAGSCTGSFVQGTPVTLTATPSSSWVFTGWTGSVCSGTGTCALPALSANVSLGATFVQQFQLSATVSGSGTVTTTPAGISCSSGNSGTCSAAYNAGTAVTLTAAPLAGWVFIGWSGDCGGTGTCRLTMSVNRSAAATFAPTPPPAAPTGTTAVGGAGQVTITWSPATGATSYNLYWATTPGVTRATGAKIAGVTSGYVHTQRTYGTTYYYVVTAQNSNGESAESPEASATPVSGSSVLTLTGGNGQSGYPAQATGPISFTLADAISGQPVANATLAVTLPPGFGIRPSTVTTSAQGQASFAVYRGLDLGVASIGVSAPSAIPVSVSVTTVAPSPGTVFTIVNAPRLASANVAPGPAVVSPTGRPWALAADADGGFFFSDTDQCGISHVDRHGVLTAVTQQGTCYDTGDNGPAASSSIIFVRTAYFEPTRNTLTLGEGYPHNRIRQIDLNTGIIKTVVGGGANSPVLGALATSANFNSPMAVATLPSGDLWFGWGATYPSYAASVGGVLAQWPASVGSCAGALGLGTAPDSASVAAFDGASTYYWRAQACGTAVQSTDTTTPTLVTVDASGNVSYFGGVYYRFGNNTDGISVTQTTFNVLEGLAYHAGQLYLATTHPNYSTTQAFVIRKVDVASRVITTIAGDGTTDKSKDYVSALQTGIDGSLGETPLIVTSDGHIVYSQGDDFSRPYKPVIRMIW